MQILTIWSLIKLNQFKAKFILRYFRLETRALYSAINNLVKMSTASVSWQFRKGYFVHWIIRWCLTWPSCRDAWNYSIVVTSCQSFSKSSLEPLRSGASSHKSSHFPSKRCLRLCHGPHLLSYRFEPRWKAASSSPKRPPPASLRKDALSGHDESTSVGRRRDRVLITRSREIGPA